MSNKRNTKVRIQPLIEVGNLDPKPIEGNHIKIANNKEEMVNPVMLVSRLNYPTTIKYDKSIIRISPRGKMKLADSKKIKGDLPSGLSIRKIK